MIYDEIEAEVNLCFDQFLFKLGHKIFIQFKKVASLQRLPTDMKTDKSAIHHRDVLQLDSYVAILKQPNFPVFFSCNVSYLVEASMYPNYSRKC